MLLRLLVCVCSGALLATAFDAVGPGDTSVLLAVLPLAALALCTLGSTPRRSALLGLTFGAGFFFTLQWWMRAVGTDAWLGLSAVETLFMVPLALSWSMIQSRTRWWPWWCALAWVAVETVRSGWPFSGMPWGRLSYAVVDTTWAPVLPWIGFTLLSLCMALSGTGLAALAVLARQRWRTRTGPTRLGAGVRSAAPGGTAVLLGVAVPLAGWAFPWQPETTDTMTVAVVQGDVPGRGDALAGVHRLVTQNHVRATVELAGAVESGEVAKPELVLWPENSTAVDPFRDVEVRSGIDTAVQAVGTPVLVGAMVDGGQSTELLNQGVLYDPVTGAGERYTKWHPVPFGEYIPWRDLVFRSNLGRLDEIGRDLLRGDRSQPLRVGDVPVAAAICFDVAYDDALGSQIRSGAQLVTVQTSNAMFIFTRQVEQQYAITRLRALESGRSVAVAATNGISGVIGPDGEVLAQAPVRSTTTLVQEVPLVDELTPATRWGLWPGRLAVLATCLWVGAVLLRERLPYIRRRPTESSSPRTAP